MDEDWRELPIDGRRTDVERLATEIRRLPGARVWWRSVEDKPPTFHGETTYSLDVPATHYYINTTKARKFGGDIAIAVVADLLTSGAPIVTVLELIRLFAVTIRHLSEDEMELVRTLKPLSEWDQSRLAYRAVPIAEIRAAYVDAAVDVDKLMESLLGKGVLQRVDGDMIQLVF